MCLSVVGIITQQARFQLWPHPNFLRKSKKTGQREHCPGIIFLASVCMAPAMCPGCHRLSASFWRKLQNLVEVLGSQAVVILSICLSVIYSLNLLLCPQVERGCMWSGMWFLSGAVSVTGAVPVLRCCWRSVPGDAALWRCGCSLLPLHGWQTSTLIYF